MQEERVVPGRLGRDLRRRLADLALLAADPLERVRREDHRRRTARHLAVAGVPRCKKGNAELALEGNQCKFTLTWTLFWDPLCY